MEQQNEKCIRCESNNLNSFIKQIRTNEIPGKYYRCLDCHYGWKQSLVRPNV